MYNNLNQRTVATPANDFPTETFSDATDAVTRLSAIYESSTSYLRDAVRALPEQRAVRESRARVLSVCPRMHRGQYPHRFASLIRLCRRPRPVRNDSDAARSVRQLLSRAASSSDEEPSCADRSRGVGQPVPIHFAFAEGIHLEGDLDRGRLFAMRDVFDTPDLALLDDRIVNGTYEPAPGGPHPLALFTAARVDFSLHRLKHYTATSPTHFQNYVLYTNYQFYIDEFVKLGRTMMAHTDDAGLRAYPQRIYVVRRAGRRDYVE